MTTNNKAMIKFQSSPLRVAFRKTVSSDTKKDRSISGDGKITSKKGVMELDEFVLPESLKRYMKPKKFDFF